MKYNYQVNFNGNDFKANTIDSIVKQINEQLGFRLATCNMIYNIISRPPKKRQSLPNIVITRSRYRGKLLK